MSRQPLTILLYGDFQWDRLAASYQRAFQELGHRVEPLDVRDMPIYLATWIRHRLGHRATIHSLGLRRSGSREWNRHVVRCGKRARADLVVILNGEFVMPETVQALQSLGSRVFIVHADNPFPPHSSSRPENLACARESDCSFIWSRSLARRLQSEGVRRVQYLAFAWDPVVFPYRGLAPEPAYDLVFIGGWDSYRAQVLETVAQRFNLQIWGPEYWRTRTRAGSAVRRSWQGEAVAGARAAQVIAASRISLNVVRRQNLPDGTIMRTFEVPGCGGFALSTRTRGALDILPEGMAGAYFGDVAECCRHIEALHDDAERRRQMARAAHEIICRAHQYRDRARHIVETFLDMRDMRAGSYTHPPPLRQATPDTRARGVRYE